MITTIRIVSGTERDLQTAANLAKVLNQPQVPNQPRGESISKVENLRAYQLKNTDADTLTRMLRRLELGVGIMPFSEAKVLIIAGAEDTLKKIDNIIDSIDAK